jgi:origin recognition complex subunit 4
MMELEMANEPSIGIGGPEIPDIEGLDGHLMIMQKLVLDKLTGRRRLKLHGLDDELQKVHQVVEQTVVSGEGNSMLIIGARGCGKTTVTLAYSTHPKFRKLTCSVACRNGYIRSIRRASRGLPRN